MERQDLRAQVSQDIETQLMKDEKVFYYAHGGGCLGIKPKYFFVVTNERAIFTTKEVTGCLGLTTKTGTQAIPLEQISSVTTQTESGCLGLTKQGLIAVSSAGGRDNALFSEPQEAQDASKVLQEIMKEKKEQKF